MLQNILPRLSNKRNINIAFGYFLLNSYKQQDDEIKTRSVRNECHEMRLENNA